MWYSWRIEELFETYDACQAKELAPDYFIIGSNGGGVAFAINRQSGELYKMPFIGMQVDESFVAEDFQNFLESLYESVN